MYHALRVSLLLAFIVLSAAVAQAAEVRLAWDPSPGEDLAGYRIYYGTASGVYTQQVEVGTVTDALIEGLVEGQTYYFSVVAYDHNGTLSEPSNEVVFAPGNDVPPSSSCNTEFSSTAQSVLSFGGTGTFSVKTGKKCAWVMGSSADWISLGSSTSGTGTKTVSYTAAPNMSAAPRTAILYSGQRSIVVTQPGRVRGDFDGDGRTDLLWQNRLTGELSIWRMNGADLKRGDYLSPANVGDTNWKIVGTLDVDRDGFTDILFQHDAGSLAVWRMQGEARVENLLLDVSVNDDPRWRVVGTGDMDQDGSDDIIWQHPDGQVDVWYMNGTTRREAARLATVSDARWRVQAVHDFDNDGRLDILWRHVTWGQFLVWNMNDRQFLNSGMYLIMANHQWEVTAVGDFDGDQRPDLIWRNAVTGELAAWLLANQTVAKSRALAPHRIADLHWRIVGPR
jgi:hypothetical protein